MKASEFSHCVFCREGVMHDNQITFFRVRIEHHGVLIKNLQRAAGLEMMIGNLAQHMGPDEDLSEAITDEQFLVCQDCAIEHHIAQAAERAVGDD